MQQILSNPTYANILATFLVSGKTDQLRFLHKVIHIFRDNTLFIQTIYGKFKELYTGCTFGLSRWFLSGEDFSKDNLAAVARKKAYISALLNGYLWYTVKEESYRVSSNLSFSIEDRLEELYKKPRSLYNGKAILTYFELKCARIADGEDFSGDGDLKKAVFELVKDHVNKNERQYVQIESIGCKYGATMSNKTIFFKKIS